VDAESAANDRVTIGFPVQCAYKGGNTTLGKHGSHFRIEDGRIGFGEFTLSHSLPLDTVASVEIAEHEFGGSDAQTLVALGAMNLGTGAGRGSPASEPKLMTNIIVRTKDGQEATWDVERRGADWVRARLTPVLRQAGIRYLEDIPLQER
jgi:hypothetical protein